MSINYCSSYDGVTIDRHALSIALGYRIADDSFRAMTRTQYEFFEECYRYTAKALGISPMLLQSSTWQVFRERKNEFDKEK
jgi:thermostable 8-oxoguanine DNA glycosylase